MTNDFIVSPMDKNIAVDYFLVKKLSELSNGDSIAIQNQSDITYTKFNIKDLDLRKISNLINDGLLYKKFKKNKVDLPSVVTLSGKTIDIDIWDDIPDQYQVTEENIGARIFVAGFLRTDKFILYRIHKKGEPGWLNYDGCTLIDPSLDRFRSFPLQSCMLHPDKMPDKTAKKKKSKYKF